MCILTPADVDDKGIWQPFWTAARPERVVLRRLVALAAKSFEVCMRVCVCVFVCEEWALCRVDDDSLHATDRCRKVA
jgi:hypothetical protein